MKKILIGMAILGVYALYSLGIRHHDTPTIRLKGPANSTGLSTNGSSSTSPANSSSAQPLTNGRNYKDGTYKGSVADAYYGNVQVSVVVSGGKITDVKFLQYPNTHPTSVYINQQAIPYLKQEAIQVQSSNVQIISGATFTSQAFLQSMQAALNQA